MGSEVKEARGRGSKGRTQRKDKTEKEGRKSRKIEGKERKI